MQGKRFGDSGRRRWSIWLMALAVLALVANGCGDDGDGESTPASEGPTTTSTEAAEPVVGGTATALLYAEIRSLDPVTFTGSGGSDGQQAFAIYGALLTLDPDTNEIEPHMAESFESTADRTEWTLKLRPGIKFSDGTDYNAAAVTAHWERIKDPANRSPGYRAASAMTAIAVVDPLTVRVTLAAPNAHFDRTIERNGGLNYVPSPTATATLNDKPVGAGPFLLQQWFRDDRMVLVRNPGYFEAPRPYLDQLTFRVITDEEQRLDTQLTGQAELNYTGAASSVARGEANGLSFTAVPLQGSPVYTFNLRKPPFDDLRLRTAFIQAIDRDALVESALGPDAAVATGFTHEGWKWHTPASAIPAYDPEAAQALFDEVAAETGGPVRIKLTAFQQSLDQLRAEFIQASLSQFENVDFEIEIVDQATGTLRVLQGEYEVNTWGFPYFDPEPGLYNAVHSKGNSNYTGYNNAQVDAWLEAARATRDDGERKQNYDWVFAQLAKDLPWYQYAVSTPGILAADDVHDVTLYHENILRTDLIWVSS